MFSVKVMVFMKNKYVTFVSDNEFEKSVNKVCEGYLKDIDNVIDPLRVIFDVYNEQSRFEMAVESQNITSRQLSLSGKVGTFHQELLGKVDGWENLKRGHPSKVDLKNGDKSIYIELKNKFNTLNSGGLKNCRNTLEKIVSKNPEATAYWAYIITKDGSSGESEWYYSDSDGARSVDPHIRSVWGKKVYELVTGNPNAMDELLIALPLAINQYLQSEFSPNELDKKEIEKLYKSGFGINDEQTSL